MDARFQEYRDRPLYQSNRRGPFSPAAGVEEEALRFAADNAHDIVTDGSEAMDLFIGKMIVRPCMTSLPTEIAATEMR